LDAFEDEPAGELSVEELEACKKPRPVVLHEEALHRSLPTRLRKFRHGEAPSRDLEPSGDLLRGV
jgi:hypothetical protein